MPTVLKLTGISKHFPGVVALDGIDLSLEAGEIHAIVGENGAGKSTLIKIISGVHQPDAGTIEIDGVPTVIESPRRARDLGVSVIYQETSLFPDFSVMENLFAGWEPRSARWGTIDYRRMKREASSIFEQLGTEIDVTAEVGTLGIADKQMVEIAKALSFKSRILIMDEPTAALSKREVDSLFRVMKTLDTQGVSIIYISHRLEEIYEIADTVTVLRDGTKVADRPVSEVTNEVLISWMVGRSMDTFYPKTETVPGSTILAVRNLSQKGILDNISFELRRNEILGVAGLAGSGRTEMALALAGFTAPDSGQILVDGKETRIRDYCEAMDHGILYVSEDRAKLGLVLPMTVRENISLAMLRSISRMGFISRSRERGICHDYIEELSIKTPDGEFTVGKLSGGNQQKVSLSKALAARPRVLILDEPTRGVDIGAKAEIHRIISDLVAHGMGIIMISSELPEIIGMSDRIMVLRHGTVAGVIDRRNATQEKILSVALGTATDTEVSA